MEKLQRQLNTEYAALQGAYWMAYCMCAALLGPAYKKRGLGGDRLARDIGCSAVDLCGLIPWCIACSVPLQVMGVGAQALPLSFLLYLLPLVTLVKDRLRAKQLKKFPDS